MARNNANMQKLIDLRDKMASEIAAAEDHLRGLRHQLKAYDTAIATMRGTELPGGSPRPRRNVKKNVLEIITEAGKAGVTVTDVMDRAAAKGRQLDRGSVSSLLSRFKREGTLTFDGERYYPANPQEPTPTLKVVKA